MINGNSFQRKLLATPYIYISIRFVFETAFISEQVAENRFGVLLQIKDKFITEFIVFSKMLLQLRLKTVWKISKPYSMTLKTVARQFCLKGHVLPQKLGMKLLEMGKDMKIKQCLLSFLQSMGKLFFVKKLCMGEQTFLGKLLGGSFTW